MSEYASPDPDFDVEAFLKRENLLAQGLCPNCTHKLRILDLSCRECPNCDFSHFVVGGTFRVEGEIQ